MEMMMMMIVRIQCHVHHGEVDEQKGTTTHCTDTEATKHSNGVAVTQINFISQ